MRIEANGIGDFTPKWRPRANRSLLCGSQLDLNADETAPSTSVRSKIPRALKKSRNAASETMHLLKMSFRGHNSYTISHVFTRTDSRHDCWLPEHPFNWTSICNERVGSVEHKLHPQTKGKSHHLLPHGPQRRRRRKHFRTNDRRQLNLTFLPRSMTDSGH